jgi:hypothetical protein
MKDERDRIVPFVPAPLGLNELHWIHWAQWKELISFGPLFLPPQQKEENGALRQRPAELVLNFLVSCLHKFQ